MSSPDYELALKRVEALKVMFEIENLFDGAGKASFMDYMYFVCDIFDNIKLPDGSLCKNHLSSLSGMILYGVKWINVEDSQAQSEQTDLMEAIVTGLSVLKRLIERDKKLFKQGTA